MCVSSRARSHCPAQVPGESREHQRHTLHMGRLLKQNKQSVRSCGATAHTHSNKGMHFLSSCVFILRASTDVYRSLPLHCIGTCNKTRGKGSNKSVRSYYIMGSNIFTFSIHLWGYLAPIFPPTCEDAETLG